MAIDTSFRSFNPCDQVVRVSFDDDSLPLPLVNGSFHVHIQVPSSIMRQLGPVILRRRHWVARLFGLHSRPRRDKILTALLQARSLGHQLSILVFGPGGPLRHPQVSCFNDGFWGFAGDSVLRFTASRNGDDSDDGRAFVFKASEELVQGRIYFTGKELNGREITDSIQFQVPILDRTQGETPRQTSAEMSLP